MTILEVPVMSCGSNFVFESRFPGTGSPRRYGSNPCSSRVFQLVQYFYRRLPFGRAHRLFSPQVQARVVPLGLPERVARLVGGRATRQPFRVRPEQRVVVAGGRGQEPAPLPAAHATVDGTGIGLEVRPQIGQPQPGPAGQHARHEQVVDPEVPLVRPDGAQQPAHGRDAGGVQPTGQERRVRVARELVPRHVPLAARVPDRRAVDHAPGQQQPVFGGALDDAAQRERVHRDVVVRLDHGRGRAGAALREPRQAHHVLVRQVAVRLAEAALHHVAVPPRLTHQPRLHVRPVRLADHEHVPEAQPVEHGPRVRQANGPPVLEVARVAVHQYRRARWPPVAAAHVAVQDVPEVFQVDQPPLWLAGAVEKRFGSGGRSIAVPRERLEEHEEKRRVDEQEHREDPFGAAPRRCHLLQFADDDFVGGEPSWRAVRAIAPLTVTGSRQKWVYCWAPYE